MYLIRGATKQRGWVFVLTAVATVVFSAATLTLRESSLLAQSPVETAPNLKVAFIGDSGVSSRARAVLQLIRDEGADMVLAQGDLAYDEANPDAPLNWDNQISAVLGPNFPLFASIGNHDVSNWAGYQQKLLERLSRIPGATCVGDYGVNSACSYRGLFFILSGVGTMGTAHDTYIRDQLAQDNSIWRICSWHLNQTAMQIGGKFNGAGWAPYEECRKGRAIVATAHEHSYERTKTLSNLEFQTVDPTSPDPNLLRVDQGSTFVFVSGLGGRSIRDQERCLPITPPYGCNGEWASIYASNQGANYGALFIEFNVDGDASKARGYFKNIDGVIVDSFTITSGADTTPPTAPLGLTANAVSEFQVDVAWSAANDPESGISGYNIYRDGLNVGNVSTTAFNDSGLAQNTTYSYEVSALNGAGIEGPRSAPASATTLLDTTPPSIVSAGALGDSVLEVVFSEPVDPASASLLSNYAITGTDGSSIAVSATFDSVTNAAAGKAVLLTDAHLEGVTYTVTVSAVTDPAGNSMSGPSSASYVFVPALVITSLTTDPTLDLAPTYESIGVYLGFAGDDNRNNQALLEYREQGASLWITGMEMSDDRRATVTTINATYTNPFVDQWRASILGLTSDTVYEVRVTLADDDGVIGANPVTATIRTRSEVVPLGTGDTYYVSVIGSDLDPGTLSQPLRTIQRAADIVQAGDTVYIREGTYTELITITKNGTPTNWITFMPYNDEAVTIDGEGVRDNFKFGGDPLSVDVASYIRIKGLRFINAIGSAMTVNHVSTEIVIEDSYIAGFGDNGIFVGGSSGNPAAAQNIIIQRNEIIRTTPKANGKEGHLISFWRTQGGHVIRDNIIRDVSGTGRSDGFGYWDCIGGGSNHGVDGFVNRDTDIYNNLIEGCNDDGIESEGGNVNVRIWNNTIRDTFVGIAYAPNIVGPLYVYRNVIDIGGINKSAAFKLGNLSGGSGYIYHNTIYLTGASINPSTDGLDGFKQTNGGLSNLTSKNNIVRAGRYVYEISGVSGHAFDYNALFTTDSGRFMKWDGSLYGNLSSFSSATGHETNGVQFDAQSEFLDPANGDFRLRPGSVLIDRGAILRGFNDPDSAWPFSGAAPDIGAFEVPDLDPSAPPVRSNPTPVGELQPGTTQATLGLLTNKAATCKYSQTPNVSYESMPNTFQNTGGPEHSTLVGGLEDGRTYDFYVRCSATTPNLDDLLISFSVRAIDTTPPVATNLQTSWANNALVVSWDTDDSSTVSVAYGLSPTSLDQSVSDGVLRLTHSVMLSGLLGNTVYYYQLGMCNVDGACGSSAVETVTTGALIQELIITALTTASGAVYEVSDGGLSSGASLYIDRGYSFSSIPPSLEAMTYIRTANDDKSRTDPVMVSFLVNQDVTVYVAYDARATSLPDWLAGWSSIGVTLATTDNGTDRDLYGKELAAGQISLGGNLAAGASGAESNYSIIVSSSTGVTLPGMNAPAQDLDGDGTAEDLNGNGLLDFADVVAMFQNMDSPEVTGNLALFDFNGNGLIDMDDVVALFEQTIGA